MPGNTQQQNRSRLGRVTKEELHRMWEMSIFVWVGSG